MCVCVCVSVYMCLNHLAARRKCGEGLHCPSPSAYLPHSECGAEIRSSESRSERHRLRRTETGRKERITHCRLTIEEGDYGREERRGEERRGEEKRGTVQTQTHLVSVDVLPEIELCGLEVLL